MPGLVWRILPTLFAENVRVLTTERKTKADALLFFAAPPPLNRGRTQLHLVWFRFENVAKHIQLFGWHVGRGLNGPRWQDHISGDLVRLQSRLYR